MEISDDAVQFGAFVLAHCAAIAATSEPGDLICPFAVYVKDGVRQLQDFEADTQGDAVAAAWEHFEQSKDAADFWALGREGYYTFPDGKSDVLVSSFWKRGMEEPVTLLQRFTPTSSGSFALRGATEILINNALFGEPNHPFFAGALAAGIANHPKGVLWTQWKSDA